jgi:hypothetical protein
MEKRKRVGLALSAMTVGILFSMPTVGQASIPGNLGFEDDLTAWTVTKNGGDVSVVDSYIASVNPFIQWNPVEVGGEAFLLLGNAAPGEKVKVSQTFDLTEGAVLSGYYAFSAPGFTNDISMVTISGAAVDDVLEMAGLMKNLYDGQKWHDWEWTAPNAGSYTLSYELFNIPFDGNGRSFAMFDAAVSSVPMPVPIPGAALLLGSGLMGMVGVGSRKKRNRLG